MVESGSSWLDEWLVIKGAFTNSHELDGLQTQLHAIDFTYQTGPFRFSFIWSLYRHYLAAGGRFSLEIARCPSTDHKDTDRVHPPFLPVSVDKSVHRSVTGQCPTGNQKCPLDAWLWFLPFV